MRRALTILLLTALGLNAAIAGVARSTVLCMGSGHPEPAPIIHNDATDNTTRIDCCSHDHAPDWPTPVPADDHHPGNDPDAPCGCFDVELIAIEVTPPAEPDEAEPLARRPLTVALAMLTPDRPELRSPADKTGPPPIENGIGTTRLTI